MIRHALAALALLAAAPVIAQQPLPGEVIPRENRARFRVCRAAIFYQLDDQNAAANRLPDAFARTLLEQMSYVMRESIRNAPKATVDAGVETIAFVEGFFIEFSRAIAEHRELMDDVEARERTLVECQSFLWPIVKARIDYAARWRNAAEAPPE